MRKKVSLIRVEKGTLGEYIVNSRMSNNRRRMKHKPLIRKGNNIYHIRKLHFKMKTVWFKPVDGGFYNPMELTREHIK